MSNCYISFFSKGLVPALLVLLLFGCSSQREEVRFVATIPPLRAIVEPVAGEPVGVLVPTGGSPHTHEPKPSDARQSARAAVLFYGSEELDGWAASLHTERRVALLDLLPDSVRRPAYRAEGTDPHFWMDPRAVRALVPALAETLCRYDSEGCSRYRRNAQNFGARLEVIHDSLRTIMAPAAGASVLVSHPFLEYFAARYGLHVAGIVEEMSGSEPTLRDMRRMLEAARASSARAIFTQPQHSSRAAEAVARAAGIPVVELDPIGAADNLPDLLYLNARRIRDALLDTLRHGETR